MNYGQQVVSRMLNPGLVLLIIGAVAVYGSGWLARRIAPAREDKVSLACKAVGCVIAIVGALLALDIL